MRSKITYAESLLWLAQNSDFDGDEDESTIMSIGDDDFLDAFSYSYAIQDLFLVELSKFIKDLRLVTIKYHETLA